MDYEAAIGLEIHAELATKSKMFCGCPVVDATQAKANSAVCPVCSGMPGTLPVINRQAVELGLRVALALACEITNTSIFARKNYFYPDLPKGYQISQYEQPLARNGRITLITKQGKREIRIRRVHLEEDTGKLTHITKDGQSFTLVDLNRAGVPLLEIVSEPDLHNAEEVRAYATSLRSLLRYLRVNSGDMQKGVLRIEPNVSVNLRGAAKLGTRSEIKNLNSFRSLERSVNYEIQRQIKLLKQGKPVKLETRGWDDVKGSTVAQRSKEEAHDYRYFPEPDLPPLVLEPQFIAEVRDGLPELPSVCLQRFEHQYRLSSYDAGVLTAEREVADYFEAVMASSAGLSAKSVANWITGELFALMNQTGLEFQPERIAPHELAKLISMIDQGKINQGTGKSVLTKMFTTGETAEQIVTRENLQQISDRIRVANLVKLVLEQYPKQVQTYQAGKKEVAGWLFGKIMQLTEGRANPDIVKSELQQMLEHKNTKK